MTLPISNSISFANASKWGRIVHIYTVKRNQEKAPLPQEKLCVIHPLVDEVGSDGLWVMWEVHVVHSVDEQGWVVVQSGYGHLKTHGPQLTGLHPSHQTLQYRFHKQGDALQVGERQRNQAAAKPRRLMLNHICSYILTGINSGVTVWRTRYAHYVFIHLYD